MESEKLKSGIGGGSHYRASGLVPWHKTALLGSSARLISRAAFDALRPKTCLPVRPRFRQWLPPLHHFAVTIK